MGRYAIETSVSVDSSIAEIRKTLTRYGAQSFAQLEEGDRAMIVFHAQGRRVRFIVPLPDRNARRFWYTEAKGLKRSQEAAFKEWEQACRQRWRALSLVIKAKLEAVECGIATFEDEFLANIVLPNNDTVGDWMRPQIAAAYEHGTMPPLLPMGGGR